jgi:rod shape-determining protein MreD
MNGLRTAGLLFAAGLLQVFLPRVWSPLGAVDWLLIYVVHEALSASFRRSILVGAAAGLLQDGLSGGIVGLHAFAKTTVAALTSSAGNLLVVRGPMMQALATGAAALVESLIVVAWQAMLVRPASLGLVEIAIRALATGAATAALLLAGAWFRQRQLRRGRARGRGFRI